MADDDLLLVVAPDDEPIADPRDTPDPTVPDAEPTPAELKAKLAEAEKLAGHYASERDIALESLRRPVPAQPAQAPVQDNNEARQKYEAYVENIAQKQLMGDSKGATQDIFAFVDYLVTEKTKSASAPIASSTARQAVRNFEATMRDDDLYPVVADKFKSMVDTSLPAIAAMPVDQQDGAIEALYNIAVGQSARARARNGRREEPPPYATGSSSSGRPPATRQRQLTDMQKQYVLSAREAQIPEERIKRVLDEMENPA